MKYRIKNNLEEPEKVCLSLESCARHIQKRVLKLTHNKCHLEKILKRLRVSSEFKYVDYNLMEARVLIFKVQSEQSTRKEIHSPN
jgi:hypothetical protein